MTTRNSPHLTSLLRTLDTFVNANTSISHGATIDTWPHLPACQAFRRLSRPRVASSAAPNALISSPERYIRAMGIYSGSDVVPPVLLPLVRRRSPLAGVVVGPLGRNESAVPDPVRPLMN